MAAPRRRLATSTTTILWAISSVQHKHYSFEFQTECVPFITGRLCVCVWGSRMGQQASRHASKQQVRNISSFCTCCRSFNPAGSTMAKKTKCQFTFCLFAKCSGVVCVWLSGGTGSNIGKSFNAFCPFRPSVTTHSFITFCFVLL